MIKVTFRRYPTNFTSNHIETFNNLESALKVSRERDMLTVRIEEDGVGWHMVTLTKDGTACLGQDYSTPNGGSVHYSDAYKKTKEKLDEEGAKPKLA
jgi:uncharacterized protein YcgI (DUF1989 family)